MLQTPVDTGLSPSMNKETSGLSANPVLTLNDVAAGLTQDGWRGFTLLRRFLGENPRQRRVLAHVLRALPWEQRSDFPLRHVHFAFLGSFSTENLTDAVALAALDRGLIATQYHAPFNQLSLIVRDAQSRLYHEKPDVVVVAVAPADRLGTPWGYPPEGGGDTEGAAEAFLAALLAEVTLLHERAGALVLLHNFAAPEFRPAGLQGWRQPHANGEFYTRLNRALSERCRQLSWLHIVDVARLYALSGARWPTLHQPRFLGAYRLPEEVAWLLGQEYAALAAAVKGFVKKCLVVDLDNTLWGGVVGEEGTAGVLVGGGYPGNIYQELQHVIHALQERGVLLAINSKNNATDAWEPFLQRAEMVLRREHFSAWRINWQDKATNLYEIAQELNLGLESFVLLDDSPTERAWVEERFPEVYVLPAQDPLDMVRLLSTTSLFDSLENTAEDLLRAKSYAAMAQRRELQATTQNVEDFLAQLEVQVAVFRPQESQLGRIAQLTQKTNQFNLTTRRYTHEQIKELWTSPEVEILCCSVRDKFADEGLVGVVLLRRGEEEWVIDTFLLSCRVLGRGVERALLWAACQKAAMRGGGTVRGEYRRSAKNGQTEYFYRDQGFALGANEGDHSQWGLMLPAPATMLPAWIQLDTRLEQI